MASAAEDDEEVGWADRWWWARGKWAGEDGGEAEEGEVDEEEGGNQSKEKDDLEASEVRKTKLVQKARHREVYRVQAVSEQKCRDGTSSFVMSGVFSLSPVTLTCSCPFCCCLG